MASARKNDLGTDMHARLSRAAALKMDDALTGDDPGALPDAGTPAAVLVAIVDRPEPGLLLTVRTASLRNHPGQIAFAGGRIDPGESAVQAALREAEEEIGLRRDHVAVLGTGDRYLTVTGFLVTPVIALIPPDVPLVANEVEVADAFEAPLAFVTDPGNQIVRMMNWRGRPRAYYEILWKDRRIWGATAAMIVNLSRRLATA